MQERRAGCNAAIAPDGRLFVVGGGPDGRSQHATMEALDPREKRWSQGFAALRLGRHYNAASFGPDGCLYVAGAFRHSGQLDACERWDPRLDRWEELPAMSTGDGAPLQFSAGAWVW